MKKYVIGLDNGCTVSKAALFDMQGHEIAVASKQTPLITPHPGYNERNMEDLWQYNYVCIREVKNPNLLIMVLYQQITVHGGIRRSGRQRVRQKPCIHSFASS